MKIALLHAGALGDLINTFPAFAALRERFPDAEVSACGRPELLALPLASGLIDAVESLEQPGFHLLFGPGPAANLPGPLRERLQSFDLVVSWVRSPELARNLAALGLNVHVHPGPFPPPAGGPHATDHQMLALRGLGINPPAGAPRLPAPPSGWPGPRFPGILVHPGSGSPRKNWPAERFAEAVRLLARRSGLPVAVLSGPADGDAAATTFRLLRAGEPDSSAAGAKFFGGLSLLELAGLLSSARLALANDSGVAHLAGAVGTPVAAVFGPSDPSIWGVRQERVKNIRRSDCPPCFDDPGRNCEERVCLLGLTAEEVAAAAVGLL